MQVVVVAVVVIVVLIGAPFRVIAVVKGKIFVEDEKNKNKNQEQEALSAAVVTEFVY